MKITVRFWKANSNKLPDWNERHTIVFVDDTANGCMEQVRAYKEHHDLEKYTWAEIINVED